jgi:hypothetical protein
MDEDTQEFEPFGGERPEEDPKPAPETPEVEPETVPETPEAEPVPVPDDGEGDDDDGEDG